MLKSHSRSSRRPLLLIIGLLAGGCLLVLGLMTWVGFNLLAGTSLDEGQLNPGAATQVVERLLAAASTSQCGGNQTQLSPIHRLVL